MSTNNQSINIEPQNVVGKCDLKCSYIFNYKESNLNAKNNDEFISLTYDNGSTPPVLFNQQKYNVNNINIYAPSIHLFNGAQVPGEIVIEHVPQVTGELLSVCIPLIQSSNTTDATTLITEIINGVSSGAPSAGETTTLNINNFSLQYIIPKKPYFFYNDYSNHNFVVYGSNLAIPLSQSTFTTLTTIIKPCSIIFAGTDLYYNSKGPGSDISGNDIYISCKPTGSSEETTETSQPKTTTPINWSAIFASSAFQTTMQVILIILIFLLIFYGINSAYKYAISGSIKLKMPSFRSSSSTST